MRNCELKNDSFSIHFTILLANDSRKHAQNGQGIGFAILLESESAQPLLIRLEALCQIGIRITGVIVAFVVIIPPAAAPDPRSKTAVHPPRVRVRKDDFVALKKTQTVD